MNIAELLENKDADELRGTLTEILTRYTQPAFGALPKRETDIMMFEIMRSLGVLAEDASVYDLMTDLRITRAKASSLLFDAAVRKLDDNPALMDAKVIEVLCHARFHKDQNFFAFEVEDPMINAHLKEMVRKAGHLSDSSFNPSLIRLPHEALADVTTHLIPEERHQEIKDALVAAGAPEDLSLKSVLKSSFKALGRRVLGDAVDTIADEAGTFLDPILKDGVQIAAKWAGVFPEEDDDVVEA